MPTHDKNLSRAEREGGPITALDMKAVKASEAIADNPAVKAVGKASELADQPPLIGASIAVGLAGLVLRNPRLMRTGLRMLASHGLATGVKTVIKDNFDRPRPNKVEKDGEHDVEPGHSKEGDERSLPSGHSAGAIAVARAIGREYSKVGPVAVTAAGLAAAVQVPRKAHFPSDVALGLAIGWLSEVVVNAVTDRVLRKP